MNKISLVHFSHTQKMDAFNIFKYTLSTMLKKIGCLFLVGLWLTGCSPKGSSSTESPISVTVQLKGGIEAESAGYYIALNKGFYLDEGVDVKLIPGDLLTRQEDPVLSGTVTFGVMWLPRLLVLRDQGKSLVHLAQIFQKSGTRLVAKRTNGINYPIDLLHHRASIWPEGNGYEFGVFLGENGVGSQFVQISEDKEPLKAFMENRTDIASLLSYKDYQDLMKQKLPNLLVFDGTTESWGLPQDCIFATEQTAANKKDLCERFLRASIKGWEYVLTNPKESAQILKDFDKTNKLDVDYEMNGIREIGKLICQENNPTQKIGYLSTEEFNRVNQLLVKYQILKNPVKDNVLDSDIWKDIYKP